MSAATKRVLPSLIVRGFSKEMEAAIAADAAKLEQMTGVALTVEFEGAAKPFDLNGALRDLHQATTWIHGEARLTAAKEMHWRDQYNTATAAIRTEFARLNKENAELGVRRDA